MWDPIIRYRFDALCASVIANSVFAKLSVDQGGELASGL
jgi:hypothetical protein